MTDIKLSQKCLIAILVPFNKFIYLANEVIIFH